MNYGQKKNIYFEFSPHILHKSPHFAPKMTKCMSSTQGDRNAVYRNAVYMIEYNKAVDIHMPAASDLG